MGDGPGITHLRSIDISAEEPAALLPFYEEAWGLERVEDLPGSAPDGALALRARGPEHHVLRLVPGAAHQLVRIVLGARDAAAVDAVAERVRASGAPILTGPVRRAGGEYAVEFTDPEGRRIEVSADAPEHPGPASRDYGPDRLSHAVLNAVDVAASTAFFVDVLGFAISDRYENDQMVFLRCNPVHHCIVLAAGEWTSLNHVAFEVKDVDEVMRALGRIRKAGFDTIWGPGRHGPGGNVFCYFLDPAGTVIEYTAELIEVGGDWTPQQWARTQENADVWGTSGGITPEVVRAMANPPAGERVP
jgi:catechol 2,3-dioxygenase-like lactoylglutathione lyase family enzyme